MRAMVLPAPGAPLQMQERTDPIPGDGEIRVRVSACGVCRTDLHVVDAELPGIKYPVVPGHEIVGRVDLVGRNVTTHRIGDRVGIPWLGYTCGVCRFCKEGMENLCDRPLFTGYTRDGGFATHTIADARYAFPLGEDGDDVSIAPLLCAGLIGWRSLVMAGNAEAARHLWLRRGRAHRRPDRALAGPRPFMPSRDPVTSRRRILPADWARCGPARRTELPDDAARCRHHLRAGRRTGAGGAARGAQGRQGGMRRNPHERYSELSLRSALGRTTTGVGGQSHAPGRAGFPQNCPAGRNPDPDHGISRLPRPTTS